MMMDVSNSRPDALWGAYFKAIQAIVELERSLVQARQTKQQVIEAIHASDWAPRGFDPQ